MTTETTTPQNNHSKQEYYTAWIVYGLVLGTFVTVATVAVVLTSQRESEKYGFQAIETTQPISFFDKTYMKKHPDNKAAESKQH